MSREQGVIGYDKNVNVADPVQSVNESAARLQELVPDTVLVGGSAADFYAHHRYSHDHDHVISDLRDRFDLVLDALEREGDWITNRVVPGKLILGELGDIEAGVRQLIRRRPLETVEIELESGKRLRVPTAEETLRIKGFLIVKRNQVRDYLDVAGLTDSYGSEWSGGVLARIDDYYADQHGAGDGVATQLAKQLTDPRPRDSSTIGELATYRGLNPRWHDWKLVRTVCASTALEMVKASS